MSNAQYQYTLRGDNLDGPDHVGARACCDELRRLPAHRRRQHRPAEPRPAGQFVDYDRDTAARLGISPQLIDNTLYDAFGQRQVSTMYTPLNQYHVVMEARPGVLAEPADPARHLSCARRAGQQVPLSAACASRAGRPRRWPVNHQGQFPAVTISFNLAPGVALGDAVDAIDAAAQQGRPAADHPDELLPAPRRPSRTRSPTSRS